MTRYRLDATTRFGRVHNTLASADGPEGSNATVEIRAHTAFGDITIHRHVAVSDVGKSINKLQVQMQDEGAAIMGLGHTLMEEGQADEARQILEHVDRISALDLEGVDPTSHVIELENVWRADEPEPCLPR